MLSCTEQCALNRIINAQLNIARKMMQDMTPKYVLYLMIKELATDLSQDNE